jgi:hypothetical protein
LLSDDRDRLMRIAVGAHEPAHRAYAGVERSHSVSHLRLGDDHHRLRIAIETAIVYVAGDSDDLARRLVKLRANALADNDLLADGVLFGPELFGHGLVDEDHAGRAG